MDSSIAQEGTKGSLRRIPGEAGVWVLIFGDLFVFALFFGTFAYYRLLETAVFAASHDALNQPIGLLNTILLLTSSLFVVQGVEAGRRGKTRPARLWTAAAMVLGSAFIALKVVEYAQKIAEGHSPTSNNFFTLYFAFTGIHALHVLVGLGVLAFLRERQKTVRHGHDHIADSCGLYWHMVDVLWVVIFAIFYVHR